MRAYSNDLCQRILRAVDQGHRQAEIAATFQVSVATSKRYLKQRREIGTLMVKPIPGRLTEKREALEAELPGQLAALRVSANALTFDSASEETHANEEGKSIRERRL